MTRSVSSSSIVGSIPIRLRACARTGCCWRPSGWRPIWRPSARAAACRPNGSQQTSCLQGRPGLASGPASTLSQSRPSGRLGTRLAASVAPRPVQQRDLSLSALAQSLRATPDPDGPGDRRDCEVVTAEAPRRRRRGRSPTPRPCGSLKTIRCWRRRPVCSQQRYSAAVNPTDLTTLRVITGTACSCSRDSALAAGGSTSTRGDPLHPARSR